MPLTPTLPVNKNTLDATIAANIIDNDEQLITALKLRETLTPIVNSTYGLKTIWAGYIFCKFNSVNIRTEFQYFENYYDPYYFPPVQDPGGSVILNSELNKYQVLDLGTELRVNGLENGSFENVQANLSGTNTGNGRFGGGLTFNGTISGGKLASLTVNNPGIGYRAGSGTTTQLELQLSKLGSGTLPRIRFNMQHTIWPSLAVTNGADRNDWNNHTSNIFMPQIAVVSSMPPLDKEATFAQLYYSDCGGSGGYDSSTRSRISAGFSNSASLYTTGGTINPDLPGFMFEQVCPVVFGDTTGFGSLEIKVPIIYQP